MSYPIQTSTARNGVAAQSQPSLPEVFRMMGGEIGDSASEPTETFWLVVVLKHSIDYQPETLIWFQDRRAMLKEHNPEELACIF